ncbi:MobF family relaxase [Acidovorax soli]|uniref:Conjugative relaxase domain-containing protein, TrwC/TraI family n=1 Tax=Acidovorax soli TaxID=592050 RepID=A0A1H4B625_9BURK|nr:MobF family relaxase [Acidovorax soli]SEA43579.1 conjugative relaxase domain-containing protein, TrwC/TraI family [Acidovorax soli]
MLSITKIGPASTRPSNGKNGGYLGYLEPGKAKDPAQRAEFDEYARGQHQDSAPKPFWACKGAALLGLDAIAEAEQVERLAKGFHPITGAPMVIGAGDGHSMGLDLTFSAPKDFSALYAGADQATQQALLECLHGAAKAALDYAEAATVTRHGVGGKVKQIAEAAIASCYTHFASRALDPQLHVHAFLFNVGKRIGIDEWSALEQRPQFERKMATGILFRSELAWRLSQMGFGVQPAGPYFAVDGISDELREALSKRSKEIADYMKECGLLEVDGAAAREMAAMATRGAKKEPPLPELLKLFRAKAQDIGLTPQTVAALRANMPAAPSVQIDHGQILEQLMASQSCATANEALSLICQAGMGRWSAARCLDELKAFMIHTDVVQLGRTEQLIEVFTSKATLEMERAISDRVRDGKSSAKHSLDRKALDKQFDQLESELSGKLGVSVSLAQQRAAALHIGCETGNHAFVEGWAGTGKTTMLKAVAKAYKGAGFDTLGCCQSAAAAQNLSRETGIRSKTIASLLISISSGRIKLGAKSILFLDEAGMVGSREFGLLQKAAIEAGAKLVCVGDPKQLQPIDAGGIFASLMCEHGKAEISNIQRQRTDFEPLIDWLAKKLRDTDREITKAKRATLMSLPEDARSNALSELCSGDAKLSRAFEKWKARYDHAWMRDVVEDFAKGKAYDALIAMETKGRLKLLRNHEDAISELMKAWEADKTPLESKAIIAATRAEVAELNDAARQKLIDIGRIRDAQGIDIDIIHRDETISPRRFAPGDRIVFTMNDKALGVANGVTATIADIARGGSGPTLLVQLDDPNDIGQKEVAIPASFARFDHAYCLTNHKGQGRTFDSAHVLANPSMADREWTYVAASRSRFATTIYVDASKLGLVDPESHRQDEQAPKGRGRAIEALSIRMKRSGAKGTSLDYGNAEGQQPTTELDIGHKKPSFLRRAAAAISQAREARR